MNREFEIINNQKGGLLLLRKDGHRYTRNKLNGNGTILWRCVSRNVCSSSITLDINKQRILREVDHVLLIFILIKYKYYAKNTTQNLYL